MRNLLIAGNLTMPGCVGIFNLPPLLTCLPSSWCRKNCYGLKGRFKWFVVKDALLWRYKQSLKHNFVEKMIRELKRRKSIRYVRVHITGDFYSKEYIDKWVKIAKEFPGIIFRTNTRRIDFLRYIRRKLPKNFVVRESTDITRKGREIFPQAAIKDTPGSENFFVCRDNCEVCGFYCWHNSKANVVTSQIR